jgi:hypothetical protein
LSTLVVARRNLRIRNIGLRESTDYADSHRFLSVGSHAALRYGKARQANL